MRIDELMLRFFREDVGGVLIVDEAGEVLYSDERSKEIVRQSPLWKRACPPPRVGQRGEVWDLPNRSTGKPFMVTTSTFEEDGRLVQLHHFADSSLYMELFRDISDYSRELVAEKERDALTGLYNKGKLLELKRTLFQKQDAIAVFTMDVNNLKQTNDTQGHAAGDRLICKTAESLRNIEARNVLTFRTGGDEFQAVAMHVSAEDTEFLRRKWETGLKELNRKSGGFPCEVACGVAYGERGYDLEALFALADQRMYEDKLEKKRKALKAPASRKPGATE